jgi:hypothetical protein
MLKEIVIILGALGCIFLIIPLVWVFSLDSPVSFILPLVFLAIVLAYAILDIKKLYNKQKYALLLYLVFFLILAVVYSFFMLLVIFPYVTPRGLI